MLRNILFLALGFLLLIKGANYFVDATGRIAKKLGVSDFIIGLTLTAIGTSVPELAASISASLQKAPGLVIGNVLGSNIANIGLIAGVAACIRPFKTNPRMYHRDGYIFILTAVLLMLFAYDGIISRIEAAILLVLYVAYVLFLLKTRAPEAKKYRFRHFIDYFFRFEYITTLKNRVLRRAMLKEERQRRPDEKRFLTLFAEGLVKDVLIALLAIVAIVYGAKYLVDESLWLAQALSIPNNLVGLSIIAVGTSLPELGVAISAARKGMGGIIVGNILGSNIANILLIIGVSSSIFPLAISEMTITYTLPFMIFFSLLMLSFVRAREVRRHHGILALVLYLAFMTYAFVQGIG